VDALTIGTQTGRSWTPLALVSAARSKVAYNTAFKHTTPRPRLAAEYSVKPQVGMLVLFDAVPDR
jgi:hypothetical protein